MDVSELKQKINNIIDDWADGEMSTSDPGVEPDTPDRKLPEGKRAARTKASGDRVYMLDEAKKTRHWVTNPEVLKSLGFELKDVVEVEDVEMLKYQLGSAIYRVEDPQA